MLVKLLTLASSLLVVKFVLYTLSHFILNPTVGDCAKSIADSSADTYFIVGVSIPEGICAGQTGRQVDSLPIPGSSQNRD